MIKIIEFYLAGFGCIVLVIIAAALIQKGLDRLRILSLTWNMLIDSANESRDKARKLQQQLDELTCSHQCLHENFQEHAKPTQPKKAKSK